MALDVGKVTRAALPARLYRSRVRARPSSRRRHSGAPPFSFSSASFLFAECLLFVALQPPPAHLLTLVRHRRQRPRAPQDHAKVFVSPATTVCECVRECSPGWFRHWYPFEKRRVVAVGAVEPALQISRGVFVSPGCTDPAAEFTWTVRRATPADVRAAPRPRHRARVAALPGGALERLKQPWRAGTDRASTMRSIRASKPD